MQKNTTKALEKAQAAIKEKREAGTMTPVENNLIRKANKNPTSLKKAIGAFCFSCYGGTIDELPDSGWRQMIRTCTAPTCPLHGHRPYR